MHDNHRQTDKTAKQWKRCKEPKEAAVVKAPEIIIKMKWDPKQHITQGNSEDKWRHHTTDDQRPIP